MTRVRRFLAPLRIALVRLRARGGGSVLVIGGVAATAAGIALVLGGGVIARDRAFARALADVPTVDRAVQVAYFGVPPHGGDYRRSLDPPVRHALAALGAGRPIRAMLYRRTRIGGALVNLGALDGVGRWVQLRSGRLPRRCSPARCEVVQVGRGRAGAIPGAHLVLVGRGKLASPRAFGRLLPSAPGSALSRFQFSPEAPPTLLVAEGVAVASALPALESIFRSYLWFVPLRPDSVHAWESAAFADSVTRARSTLEARSFLFDITAPSEELDAADDAGRIAERRLLLVGGQAAGLLLAFAVLAAAGMRRDVEAAWQRLTWFGARRWQLVLLSAVETLALAAVGTLLGWAVAIGLTPLLAERAGSPAGSVLLHSLLSARGAAVAGGLLVVAAAVVFVSVRLPALRLGTASLSALDLVALAALGALALALARGRLEPGELGEEGGTVTLLLLLPGLVAVVAAVAAARVLPLALLGLQRLARRGSLPLRLAALSLARSPGRAAVAVSFLVVSVGLALFAATYRSTLDRGQADQAHFAFPLDFVLSEDLRPTRLVPPLRAAPLERYRALGPDVRVVPAIRLRGSLSRFAESRQLTVLGVSSDDLPAVRGWREDFAPLPLAELARHLAPSGPVELRGPRIPRDARELLLPAALRGDAVAIEASILTPRGDFVHVGFGELHGAGRRLLAAPLPQAARGGRLVALQLGLTRASQETGGPEQGLLSLGPLAVRGADSESPILADYGGWVGVNGVEVDGATLRFFVTNQVESLFRPRQPNDGQPVPVVTTPALARAAGPGGILPLQLAGGSFRARVVATAERFPSVFDEFVLADERLLFAALNADAPGSAVVNEIWVRAPSRARAADVERDLRRAPFDVLELRSRRVLEAELEGDPLARAILVALAAAAAAALALGLGGLLLLLVTDLRDERGQLFDLEAEGADPAALRRHIRLRTLVVVALGIAGGLVTGAVLARVVVDLVALTASAGLPEPPLVLAVDWPVLGLALIAYAAAAAVVVAVPSRYAFRAATPGRPLGVEP